MIHYTVFPLIVSTLEQFPLVSAAKIQFIKAKNWYFWQLFEFFTISKYKTEYFLQKLFAEIGYLCPLCLLKNITQQNNFLTIFYLVDFFRICTQEPGSVLRNLYVLYLWIVDLSSGTVVILLKPVLGTLKFMYWGFWVQIIEKSTSFLFFPHKCPNSYDYNNSWCFNNLSYLMDHRIGIWAQKDWL